MESNLSILNTLILKTLSEFAFTCYRIIYCFKRTVIFVAYCDSNSVTVLTVLLFTTPLQKVTINVQEHFVERT